MDAPTRTGISVPEVVRLDYRNREERPFNYPCLGEVMRQLSRPTKDQAMKAVVDADISDLEWSELAQRIERDLLSTAQNAARAGRGRRARDG